MRQSLCPTAALILSVFFISLCTTAVPHQTHQHYRRGVAIEKKEGSNGSARSLIFRPNNQKETNQDFYIYSRVARSISDADTPTVDAEYDGGEEGTDDDVELNSSAAAVTTSSPSDTFNVSLACSGLEPRAIREVPDDAEFDKHLAIPNPHYRLHREGTGNSWPEVPQLNYHQNAPAKTVTMTVSRALPNKSSFTLDARTTLDPSASFSRSSSSSGQNGLTFTLHLSNNAKSTGTHAPASHAPATVASVAPSTVSKTRSWTISFVASTTTNGKKSSKIDASALRPTQPSSSKGVASSAPSIAGSPSARSSPRPSTSTLLPLVGTSSRSKSLVTRPSPMPTVNDTLSIPASPLHSPSPSPSPASSPSSEVKVSAAGVSTPSIVQPPPIRLGSGTRIIVPNAFWNDYLGTSTNVPTLQFWQRNNPPAAPLAPNLLSVGVNDFLTTGFGLAADTGVVRMDDPDKGAVTSLKYSPHLSRDGGKGGYLNGQKLFIFCDTGSYTPPSNGRDGDFQGFVSSSVAVDVGMNAANRRTLSIEDGMGEWTDDSGRMRGFAPLTEGEQSYNLVMQGKGQRYAIWPESSIIPLNHTHAILYSPIVYDNVDMSTGVTTFTYTGATLLAITTQAIGGPRASRLVDKIFYQDEVEWGTIGGLRSWGPSGVGGNDGRVYVFGKVQWGLLIGRVDARHIDNRDSYEYWDGSRWEQGMPPSSSTAYFINGAIMDADIFYSPRHLTFIIVYLTPWADNTFYYRYLDAPNAIYPQSGDYAEALVKYKWSPEKVLYRAPAGPTGHFIYAGAVQLGYFDGDDIANGGYKMLLTWTVPTGQTPGSTSSEYQFNSADVIFA